MASLLRRKKYYVFYPEYFDKNLSRSEGRKVPKSLADDSPSLRKLVFSCKKLGLKYVAQADKSFPSRFWTNSGRVLVEINKSEKIPKTNLLKQIADISRRVKKKEQVVEKGTKRHPDSRAKTKKNVSAKHKRKTDG